MGKTWQGGGVCAEALGQHVFCMLTEAASDPGVVTWVRGMRSERASRNPDYVGLLGCWKVVGSQMENYF